jgi:hypothetical protein
MLTSLGNRKFRWPGLSAFYYWPYNKNCQVRAAAERMGWLYCYELVESVIRRLSNSLCALRKNPWQDTGVQMEFIKSEEREI